MAIERIGYPTQKPEELLETIIKAGSNSGETVADFFIGGGTTAAVAQRLGRRWIACDQSRVAVAITADRLTRQVEEQTGKLFPVPDFTVEHWGVYKARRLSDAPTDQFRAFVSPRTRDGAHDKPRRLPELSDLRSAAESGSGLQAHRPAHIQVRCERDGGSERRVQDHQRAMGFQLRQAVQQHAGLLLCNIEMPRERLAEFCRRNHIRRLSLFGSILRDDFGPDSDIDFLVEFEPGQTPGLLGIAGMEIELSEMIGRKADLRMAQDLSRYFRDKVVREAELQYAS